VLVKDNSIEVYVAGPGFGEGALIIIGGTLVIGIDSCVSLMQRFRGGQSFLEGKLDINDEQLSFFWVLTHFHSDHFQGFSSILNQFGHRLKRVVVPLDYTSADIAANILGYEAKASRDRDSAYYLARGEYQRIRSLLNSEALQHLYISGSGKQVLIDTNLKTQHGTTIPLEVSIHGPQRELLNDLLGRETPLALDDDTSREIANQGSYIVYVKCGKFEGLFLGDAPCVRTQQALLMRKCADGEIFLLKVAHHGSDDGTNEMMLESMCKSAPSERYAMIAPFKRHDLPKADVVQLLRNHGFKVIVSGMNTSNEASDSILSDFRFKHNVDVREATAAAGDIVGTRFTDL
jgi:hypothetical protein